MSKKEMLINYTEGEECRIAIMQKGRLEELYLERTTTGSHVGNIYKARVTNVEPSIQAAFVDFGFEKNGFLHISDLQPSYFRSGDREKEDVGCKTSRRDRPPIQECLRRGQEVIVQVTKEGIGTKGPTLTTYLSIPGRFLVLMPGMARMGVSRKIEDEEARRDLRELLEQLQPPENIGFIIRTAGMGRTKTDLQRDLNYLVRLWKAVERKMESQKAPAELYQESDLVIRTIRDIYTADIERIICDNEAVARQANDFLTIAMPRSQVQVELYNDPVPLFHKYGLEREMERIHNRVVPLRIGGSLVVDQAEALVAIDVNSGKFRKPDNPEETAFQINKEAAVEIARQLRLRDLGGVIICDFIDMMDRRHQREIEQTLKDAMKNDRARSKVSRLSQFGIIEMTRQRLRPSLKRSFYHDCPNCGGGGSVKTPESVCLDAMRLLQLAGHKQTVRTIEVHTSHAVSEYLNNKKRRALADVEEATGKRIVVLIDPGVGPEQLKIKCLDGRGVEVRFDALEFAAPGTASVVPLTRRRGADDEVPHPEAEEADVQASDRADDRGRDDDPDRDDDRAVPVRDERDGPDAGRDEPRRRDERPMDRGRPPEPVRPDDEGGGRRRGRRGGRGRGRDRDGGEDRRERGRDQRAPDRVPERGRPEPEGDRRRSHGRAEPVAAGGPENADRPFGFIDDGGGSNEPAPREIDAEAAAYTGRGPPEIDMPVEADPVPEAVEPLEPVQAAAEGVVEPGSDHPREDGADAGERRGGRRRRGRRGRGGRGRDGEGVGEGAPARRGEPIRSGRDRGRPARAESNEVPAPVEHREPVQAAVPRFDEPRFDEPERAPERIRRGPPERAVRPAAAEPPPPPPVRKAPQVEFVEEAETEFGAGIGDT